VIDLLTPEIVKLSYARANVVREIWLDLWFKDPTIIKALLDCFEGLDTSVNWAGFTRLRYFAIEVKIYGHVDSPEAYIEKLEKDTRVKFRQLERQVGVEFGVKFILIWFEFTIPYIFYFI